MAGATTWRFPGASLDVARIQAALGRVAPGVTVGLDTSDLPRRLRVAVGDASPSNVLELTAGEGAVDTTSYEAAAHLTVGALRAELDSGMSRLLRRAAPRFIIGLHLGEDGRSVEVLGDGAAMYRFTPPFDVAATRLVDDAAFEAVGPDACFVGRRRSARDLAFGLAPFVDLSGGEPTTIDPVALGLPPDEWVIDAFARTPDDLFVLTATGLYRCHERKVQQFLGASEVAHYGGPPRGIGGFATRGSGADAELWIVDGAYRPHVFRGGRLEHVDLGLADARGVRAIAVDGRGGIWLAEQHRLLRGDGERWEVAWADDPDGEEPYAIQAVDATALGEAWAVGGTGTMESCSFLHATGGAVSRVTMPTDIDDMELVSVAATRDPDAVWMSSRRELVLVRAPARPRCTLRSSRSAPEGIVAIASALAIALGGWPHDA